MKRSDTRNPAVSRTLTTLRRHPVSFFTNGYSLVKYKVRLMLNRIDDMILPRNVHTLTWLAGGAEAERPDDGERGRAIRRQPERHLQDRGNAGRRLDVPEVPHRPLISLVLLVSDLATWMLKIQPGVWSVKQSLFRFYRRRTSSAKLTSLAGLIL